jgi:hypothetical protein
MQAIAMTLRCEGVAQSLGRRHNESAGVTPLMWLDHFGSSVNRGTGLKDRNRPLPLICLVSKPSGHTWSHLGPSLVLLWSYPSPSPSFVLEPSVQTPADPFPGLPWGPLHDGL